MKALRHLRKLAGDGEALGKADQELLRAFHAHGDQGAFAAIVRRHADLVFRVCRNVLGHEQDAEDSFQATFLVLARDATSIRKPWALASWLHGVAHRMAMRAKREAGHRRVRERKAPAVPARDALAEMTWREAQAAVDEEVQRLPERYRAPFVLCLLEGKGRAEAARELGLKEGTVWSRLSQARKLLQENLGRRGISLSAVLSAAAICEGVSQAAPGPLVATAARAAGRTTASSARAAALAEGMVTTMICGKATTVALCLVALGLVAVGAALGMPGVAPRGAGERGADPPAALGRAGGNLPGKTTAPVPGVAEGKASPLEEDGDKVTVSGRVLDPDGKPLAGAEISFGWFYGYFRGWVAPSVKPFRPGPMVSGRDGRFRVTFTKEEARAAMRNEAERPWRRIQVVTSAKGYGPGWAWLESARGELAVRLARDDIPVKGRVLDLQGRPVAGAAIRLNYLMAGMDYLSLDSAPGLPKAVTTDKDGRFVFTGLGRDRKAVLGVSGPRIEHKLVEVSTQGDGGGKAADSATVQVIVGPSKLIQGTVHAKGTGKPLAGMVVYGDREKHRGAVRAVTDAQGGYRLEGLPKASQYDLTVYAPAGQPYLIHEPAAAVPFVTSPTY